MIIIHGIIQTGSLFTSANGDGFGGMWTVIELLR